MRVRAAGGEPLTMSLLAQCQQIVLGLDATPGFRIRDAYAKAGRERYSAGPEVAGHFDRCLEEANGAAPAAVARAARVYLDVCFFHPFEDGNARAARLALDHVLTCAGLRLTVADPIFGFSRWADDALDAIGLPWLIQRLARAVDTAAEGQAT
ncbi:MAG TPA: Fic family protein [Kofleriaceae bacterium]|nr:Fic family protein [Kofleriaceae bacterium]